MAGAADDHVVINLSIQSTGLARAGYGIPLIPSHKATFSGRSRSYKSIGAVGADFATTSPEWRCANVMFAQTPKPRAIVIGRMAGTLTQRYDIGIAVAQAGAVYSVRAQGDGVTDTTVSYTALANFTFVDGDVNTGTDLVAKAAHGMTTGDGPYRLSNAGGALPTGLAVDTNYWINAPTSGTFGFSTSKANAIANTLVNITAAAGGGTHTVLRANNDTIIAQLVQGLSAVPGANYTVVQTVGAGETDTLRATGGAVNNWFSLEIVDPDLMSNVQSHAAPSDVTIATDLAAIRKTDASWYVVVPLYASSAYVRAVEDYTEGAGVTTVWDSCDSAIATTVQSGGTDVGALSLASGYRSAMGCYHPSPADFLAAGEVGRWFPTDPGKATPKFKTLALVRPVVLTDTHKVNIRARRMNSYEQVVVDRAFFWEGTVFSTVYKFLDITRNSAWLSDQAQKAILGQFVGSDIIPETPAGVSKLAAALRGVKSLAELQGVLAPGSVVQAPNFDDISSTDIENRNLPGLVLAGAFAGAIHSAIPVDLNLTFGGA